MPWYIKPNEYICNDCGVHFFNRAKSPATEGSYGSSPASIHGPTGERTRCADCAKSRNRHFLSKPTAQQIKFNITVTYRIHGHGSYSYLSGATKKSFLTDTATIMEATGALGRMDHPDYKGGKIRAPGRYSGTNPGSAALKAWDEDGMASHHVHVGRGINNRVYFGYSLSYYPSNPDQLQGLMLYIGS